MSAGKGINVGDLETVLEAATGGGNSNAFAVEDERSVTLMTDVDLAGSETVTVQVSYDGGSNFKNYKDGTSDVQLTASKNMLQLLGPAIYRGVKSATVSSTAVLVQR